jgi:hypothetical protein
VFLGGMLEKLGGPDWMVLEDDQELDPEQTEGSGDSGSLGGGVGQANSKTSQAALETKEIQNRVDY